jgi:hypothetical protein
MMGRRSFQSIDSAELRESRPNVRALRLSAKQELLEDEEAEEDEPLCQSFDAALIAVCAHFGLEAWATLEDEHGLRSFGIAVAQWLEVSESRRASVSDSQLDAIRMLTNLLIIVGAAVHLPQCSEIRDSCRSAVTISAARRSIGSLTGLLPPFPGSAQAMKRLIQVRGWRKLTHHQQALAESMLELFLDTLALTQLSENSAVRARVLLATAEAWLEVLHSAVLPPGFDERLLRATSWYLETYVRSQRAI